MPRLTVLAPATEVAASLLAFGMRRRLLAILVMANVVLGCAGSHSTAAPTGERSVDATVAPAGTSSAGASLAAGSATPENGLFTDP